MNVHLHAFHSPLSPFGSASAMMESTHQSKPQSYALFNDGVEVRRLELPGHKKQQLPSRHPADPLGRRTLYAGKPWALLDPAVRSVSKAAHDSALASGFPQWIADLLLQLTQEAMIAGRSHAEALFMASVAADMLNRGWRLDVTLAVGGSSFKGHVLRENTYKKFKARSWDYVILQGFSRELSVDSTIISTETIPYAQQ